MNKGKLKRKLRKQKLKQNMFKAVTALSLSIIVMVVCTLYIKASISQTADTEYMTVSKLETSAGASLAIHNNVITSVEEVENIIVQQGNLNEDSTEDKDLVIAGTLLYASTNVNARVEPSEESDRVCGVPFGSKVEVISDNGEGWLKVLYKDKEVYVCKEYFTDGAPMKLVSSTAYWDKYNRTSASGRELIEGYSVAGMVEWLHKKVNIYKCNPDGSVGDFLGTYRFDDTGYGQESGVGGSKILKGRTIGTIENGTCIDFYFENEDDCWNYGRRNVYIQVLD